ncbi:MAG: ATP-binding protein [Cytophagaceae bacterium]|jgi:hypothetical protein|nr:ATP-binding protein [Cytophagaceae bacterium]
MLSSDLFWDLHWLEVYIRETVAGQTVPVVEPPILSNDTVYGRFVNEKKLSREERLILALSIAPYINPALLDNFAGSKELIRKYRLYNQEDSICLLPTVQTALILLAGENNAEIQRYLELFDTEHLFYRQSILEQTPLADVNIPNLNLLSVAPSYRDMFILNRPYKPRFSTEFPATPITTNLGWEELVLEPSTAVAMDELKERLLRINDLVRFSIFKHKRPGFRILFYGDPGTGKTLSASLLGKLLNRDVYRIDVSAVVSKYVGETNQRLSSLFNIAENKDWILFFDEGDALLGKRTEGGSNSHYANQEVAFLLQRIERFNGIVVVATNHENNLDEAYDRRFEVGIKFKIPSNEQMLQFWRSLIPDELPLEEPDILEHLTISVPISPAYIVGIVDRAIILTLKAGRTTISTDDLKRCILAVEYKLKLRSANKGNSSSLIKRN